MFDKPENWSELTPQERQEARLNSWVSAEIEFTSTEAEEGYRQRARMIKDAIQLKRPERVPILPWISTYPAQYGGITVEEAMYDYDKLGTAWRKFNRDFMPDGLVSAGLIGPGKVFDILDYKLYQWPGHGTAPNRSYQCVEGEYMSADDYDLLIADPSNYFLRFYLPRVLASLEPWETLPPLTDMLELPFVGLSVFAVGDQDVQQAFKAYLEAGQAADEWISAVGTIDEESTTVLGLPGTTGGWTKAPYDTLGDTLRGTRGIMLDMYRRPEKLIEAMERLVPIAIEVGVRNATDSDNPIIFIPLHKGADGFMSNKDFERFYWPTLKAVLLGLIEEGTIPYHFVEGGYNERLDIITDRDIPAGHTVWMFDRTDMKEVKKKLGGWACFGGNVPGALMKAGTPQQVETYVKQLIEDVAQDGGFILSTGSALDDTTPENLHAMIEAGKKHGAYR